MENGTAAKHLDSGGVLLITGKTEEIFQNNNFAYTGDKNGVHVTLLENNYFNPLRPNTYEATLVYLIRRRGRLSVHTGRHVLGIFPQSEWDNAFRGAGLTLRKTSLDGLYDNNLLGEGECPPIVFTGRKSS